MPKSANAFLHNHKSNEYLRYVTRVNGVATDLVKIKDAIKWPPAENVTLFRSFLGLTGYYRRFFQNYGSFANFFKFFEERWFQMGH